MTIIPESIRSTSTTALDLTFVDRIAKLNTRQLLIDIANESDVNKIDLTLSLFGINANDFGFLGMSSTQKMSLIKTIIDISRNGGTEQSIIDFALTLGASTASISYGWKLTYNEEARYDELFTYDEGDMYTAFAIDIRVSLLAGIEATAYETNLRRLIRQYMPIRIFMRSIIFN